MSARPADHARRDLSASLDWYRHPRPVFTGGNEVVLLRDIESDGERNRGLYVLKARGMAHSNQIREFLITARGIELTEVYVGPEGVLTGSARAAQEARAKAAALARRQEMERKQRDLERRRKSLEAQTAALRAEFESVEEEARWLATQDQAREDVLAEERTEIARRRGADRDQALPRLRRNAAKGERP